MERRSLKKSGLQRNSNPWPPRYQCNALQTELWSHALAARSISGVYISREEWNDVKYIWNSSYLNWSGTWKRRMIIGVNFPIRRSLKKSTLQRYSNPWPPPYRCSVLPTELRSHTLEARSICGVHADFFQAFSFQLLKVPLWSNFYLLIF